MSLRDVEWQFFWWWKSHGNRITGILCHSSNDTFVEKHFVDKNFIEAFCRKIFVERHFVDITFCRQNILSKNFRRHYISSTQHFVDTTFRRHNTSSTQHFVDTTLRRHNTSSTQHFVETRLILLFSFVSALNKSSKVSSNLLCLFGDHRRIPHCRSIESLVFHQKPLHETVPSSL
jgi:hypothetical protein